MLQVQHSLTVSRSQAVWWTSLPLTMPGAEWPHDPTGATWCLSIWLVETVDLITRLGKRTKILNLDISGLCKRSACFEPVMFRDWNGEWFLLWTWGPVWHVQRLGLEGCGMRPSKRGWSVWFFFRNRFFGNSIFVFRASLARAEVLRPSPWILRNCVVIVL